MNTKLKPLFVLAAFACALVAQVAAQTTNRRPGTVVSWGTQVVPYVAPGIRFTSIAAGQDHRLALKADGTVVAWGWAGQTAVPSGLTDVVAIAAGFAHSLALKADGTVAAWGQIQKPFASVPTTLEIITESGSLHG